MKKVKCVSIREFMPKQIEVGKIYTWTSGTTSWSGEDDSMISWKYAKLATEEDMKND